MENIIYDIAIIGAGACGASAAITAAAAGKSVIIIDKTIGGKLLQANALPVYPGIVANSGKEATATLKKQLSNSSNITVVESYATFVNYVHGLIKITTEDNNFIFSKTLICATGTKPEKIKLTKGRDYTAGIYYDYLKDGPQFADKVVIVMGEGSMAEEASAYLSKICKQVIRGTVEETKVKDKVLHAAKLTDGRLVDCDAIFVATGVEPNTKIMKALQVLNSNNFVETNLDGSTKTPGIFAVGDCTVNTSKNLLDALAKGTAVAEIAIKYLK